MKDEEIILKKLRRVLMTETKVLSKMADDQSPFSNPFSMGVLGLAVASFALAPVLLVWAGDGTAAFIPWAIMFGGFAQLLGGMIDFRNKSILGATALSMYGLLWIALGIEYILHGIGWPASSIIGGSVDVMLLLMSLGFTYGFASTNRVTFWILVEIDFAFLGLALVKLGAFTPGMTGTVKTMLGILVYALGLTSVYAATAFLLNTHYNKQVLPMGKALISR